MKKFFAAAVISAVILALGTSARAEKAVQFDPHLVAEMIQHAVFIDCDGYGNCIDYDTQRPVNVGATVFPAGITAIFVGKDYTPAQQAMAADYVVEYFKNKHQ